MDNDGRAQQAAFLHSNRSQIFKSTWTGLIIPSHHESTDETHIGPLSSDQHEIQLDGLAYFEREPAVRCIWQFDEDRGETPGSSFEPGVNHVPGTDYFIISSFAPGRLVIHSPIALRAGTFQFNIAHGVLFDSNIYSRITRFVNCDGLDAAEHEATRRLIEAIVARRYDFQMLPYVVESFCVNSVSVGVRYAQQATKAILKLHLMNRELFLATGQIGIDPHRLEIYGDTFGTTKLDDIVDAQLEPYRVFTKAPSEVNLWLCSLMKMVLIRRIELPGKHISKQFAAFDDYMFNRLGMVSSKHRFMALFYFGGLLDKWIKVQRNSIGLRSLELLYNSAWDIYLGRLPDQILAGSPETHPSLTYFCTRERELATYLASSQTYMLTAMKHGGFKAFDTYDNDLIINAAGSNYAKVFVEANERMEVFLRKRAEQGTERIKFEQVDRLADEIRSDFLGSLNTS